MCASKASPDFIRTNNQIFLLFDHRMQVIYSCDMESTSYKLVTFSLGLEGYK